jgi:hypothetical protein
MDKIVPCIQFRIIQYVNIFLESSHLQQLVVLAQLVITNGVAAIQGQKHFFHLSAEILNRDVAKTVSESRALIQREPGWDGTVGWEMERKI